MTRPTVNHSLPNSLGPIAATAVGSFPGADVVEVTAIVRGELPDLPLLPELPSRGPGADMIGRTASMLAHLSSSFACQTTPTGWRITGSLSGSRPRAMRAGAAWLSEDLDAVEEGFEGYEGPFKVQLVGPWTMAAVVESPNGERLLADVGARNDLVAAMAEVSRGYVNEVARRLPGAKVVVQFDEPLLERVLVGSVVRQSGFGAIAPIEPGVIVSSLSTVLGVTRELAIGAGVHSCADAIPVDVIARAGADFISLDFEKVVRLAEQDRRVAEGQLATAIEAGGVIFAGLNLDSNDARITARPVLEFLARTGLTDEQVQHNVVLTPTCGLAGEPTLDSVRRKLSRLGAACAALRGQSIDNNRDDVS